MTLKSDAKFEEKRTLGSQNDKKLGEFYDVSSGKSGNVNFDKLPLQKVCNVLAKKNRGLVSWKMTYGSKNNISHLVIFQKSGWK